MASFTCTIHDSDVFVETGLSSSQKYLGSNLYYLAQSIAAEVPESLVTLKSRFGDIVFNDDGDDEPMLFA